jgi:formiminoglutamase
MPYNSIDSIIDFLEPVNKYVLSNDEGFSNRQLGNNIDVYEYNFPPVDADIVIIGCSEARGAGGFQHSNESVNSVRRELYKLYYWHKEVRIADAGNIKPGATLQDSYAALKTVVSELLQHCKKVVIIGGSHDLTLAQYNVYSSRQKIIEATCIDALIDLNMESTLPSDNFLMKLLTGEPNYVKHYNHVGFQSYFVHPDMLETIDKLRFDCYRVGKVKENMEEMEPVIRNAQLFSFDISAIQHAHAPSNKVTPNGFTGEEACMLMQYAGMSADVNTVGIYGYNNADDEHSLTAKQISHMLWYLMDGVLKGKQEAAFGENGSFNEFKLAFAEVETTFLQSKKTGRWWMQLPDGNFIACSHHDYLTASQNEIPERWMRAVERS